MLPLFSRSSPGSSPCFINVATEPSFPAKGSVCTKYSPISESRAVSFAFSYFTKIMKGKCKGKRKFHFRFDSAEPYPIFYKYSERRAQRQAEITFSAWLYRTAPMFYKYTNKREQSKTKLALILFSRAKVSSSFNSNIVKGECNGKWNLHFRLDSAEPYPIFYKDSEKRAEEKWPRFFILNHIVK